MSRPENMTPDEAEIWQRMELHGEELVRDMGAALMQADKLPEWMQEAAVNMLCDKLADARALAASWMNPRDKNGPAYRVPARAARDKALPLAQWQKLHDEYYERTKR